MHCGDYVKKFEFQIFSSCGGGGGLKVWTIS